MPTHASFLYARNIANFLGLLVKDGELAPDFDDEIVAGTCVVRAGQVVHAPTAEALGLPGPTPRRPRPEPRRPAPASDTDGDAGSRIGGDGVMSTGILEFLTVFVLAAFVGNEVVARVPSILHTPLMSGSNAIHGIVLVGAMIIMGRPSGAEQITWASSPCCWPPSTSSAASSSPTGCSRCSRPSPAERAGQGTDAE